ncbi:uncharacterized protein SEPMUDRAFT_150514 [Sphaerulina musiva SO2202]|uniref:MARVEL domain-containing protein n=1 Tax=Sphaerulina musiva (strain SO2202) TaxID=692275 RepID=N1QDV9_SPHMS|nr:uncharacterized protein SEPMUDRAFT_150514 [Sphaerulina musiva SO2202]EMF10381.1 hypothetical protein SEPMUDRAFT_150514 [Sphaerulina musiva SO2202]
MGIVDGIRDGHGGVVGGVARLTLRFLQFVMALTVAGLYGVDLQRGRKAGVAADGKWVYAEVVAGLSAVTILIYAITFAMDFHHFCFAWDCILFILWTALFGLFGKIYIPANPTPEQHGQQRMKSAVWVDLVNMLLWFITAIWLTVRFLTRNRRTLHTGRAIV